MKLLNIAFAWLLASALVACGGGGGGAGTSPFNPGSVTPTVPPAASIDVVASAGQLGSSGEPVTITAVVKGPGNVSIAGAPVSFASDSGNLTSAASVTDDAGIATATLSAGANRAERNIRVTVTSGSATGSVVVQVVGTTATPSAATSIDVLASAAQLGIGGEQVTISAVVKGLGNVGLAGAPVTFAADSGTLTSAASVTDATGTATAQLSAGANRNNRAITVTVTSGTVVGSITMPVVAAPSSSTSSATAIDLLASGVQLGTGGDQMTISAIVKGPGNVSLPATPVSFSADSGILTAPATVTDAAGTATATLSAGANRSNRDIRVTVVSGTITSSIVVPVAGTTLSYAGPTTLPLRTSSRVAVKLVDSKGTPIVGSSVTVVSEKGNSLSAGSMTTDAQGVASFVYTATNVGNDTLTFTGAGTSVVTGIGISGEDFRFTAPSTNAQIEVGKDLTVRVSYQSAGDPQADKEVAFAITGGTISPRSARTDANGVATAVVSSTTAGPALVQATLAGGTAQATLPIEFIALTPRKLVLQVSPTALAPNPGGSTAQQAQVVATVTDANDNPVKGVTVDFTRIADPSAGNLSQASAVTDANGQATVQYIAGAISTASNGVRLRASVSRDLLVTGDATLTVNQSALFIALGTGNTISNIDPQTYRKDWVVYVTDANGVAVPNINLTIKILPVEYLKGRLIYSSSASRWIYDSNVMTCDNEDLNVNGILDKLSASEDRNGNGILDPSEDVNGNGKLDFFEDINGSGVLEPGNVISVSTTGGSATASAGTIRTDSTGRATVSLIYAESYVPWVRVKLRAEAVVAGTESSKEAVFIVEGLADDFTDSAIAPAGVESPFGRVRPGLEPVTCRPYVP